MPSEEQSLLLRIRTVAENSNVLSKLSNNLEEFRNKVNAVNRDQESGQRKLIRSNEELRASRERNIQASKQEVDAARSNVAAIEKQIAKKRELGTTDRELELMSRRLATATQRQTTVEKAHTNVIRQNTTATQRLSGIRSRFLGVLEKEQKRIGQNNTLWQKFALNQNEASTSTRKLETRLSRLGRAMLGLGIASVIIFMHSFISALTAAAGQAVALAGSLIQVGGALGGMAAAGIAQAIPVLGILAAAFQRLSIVQQAVNERMLVYKQLGNRQQSDQNAQTSAANSLADATGAIANAQRDLNQARFDAVRHLEDLVLAERSAELALRGSILTQQEARQQLQDSIQSGDVGAIASNQLGVASANLGRRQAITDRRRAGQDLAIGRRQGVAGNPQVLDAVRSLTDAQRQLTTAQNAGAAASGNQLSAAQNYLKFYLQQLTPAERDLYKEITQIRHRINTEFTKITDIFIRSITRNLKSVEDLIFNPRIMTGLRGLATAMGNVLDRVTNALTNSRATAFFTRTIDNATQNLGPLADVATHLLHTFMNIADAAAPVLHRWIKLIADETERWSKDTKDTGGLTQFFEQGLRMARSWYGVLKGTINLIGALMDTSGHSANETLKSFADTLNSAADNLRQARPEAKKFFDDTAAGLSYIGDFLKSIGTAFVDVFQHGGVSSIKALSDLLVNVLVPGIALGVNVVGQLTQVIDDVVSNTVLARFLQLALAIKVITGSVGLLVPLFGSMFSPLRRFAGTLDVAYTTLKQMSRGNVLTALKMELQTVSRQSALTGDAIKLAFKFTEVALLIGVIVAIGQHFNILGGIINAAKAVWETFTSIVSDLVSPIQGVIDMFGKSGAAARVLNGVLGAVLGLAIARLSQIIGQFIAVALGGMYAAFIKAVGGIRSLAAAFDVLKAAIISNPIGAIAAVVGTVVGALGLFDSKQKETAVTVDQTTGALNRQHDALQALRDITLNQKDAELAAQQARLQVQSTHQTYLDSRKAEAKAVAKFGENSKEAEAALNSERQSRVAWRQAIISSERAQREANRTENDTTRQVRESTQASADAVTQTKARMQYWQDQLDTGKEFIQFLKDSGASDSDVAAAEQHLADIRVTLKQATDDYHTALHKQNQTSKEATTITDDQKGSVDNLRGAFHKIIGNITGTGKAQQGLGQVFKDITNKVLKGFGVKPLTFNIPTLGNMIGSIVGGFQSGGYIGNKSARTEDDHLVAAAGGEAFLTGHHQKWADRAMAFSNAAGIIPFGSLDEMFARDKRQHKTSGYQSGGRVPGFQRGGGVIEQALGPVNMPPFVYDPNHAGSKRHLHIDFYTIQEALKYGHKLQQAGFSIGEYTPIQGNPFNFGPITVHHESPGHYDGTAFDANTAQDETISQIATAVKILGGGKVPVGAMGMNGGTGIVAPHMNRIKLHGDDNYHKQLQGQADAYRDAFNKLMEKKIGSGAGVAGGAVPPGQVRQWLTRALKITDYYTPENLSLLFGRTMQESGGNPRAINLTDSNAAAGHPSKGLLQTIDSTFNAYKMKGHDDIWNPIDNAIAAINYMEAVYHHIVGPSGSGYQRGGKVPHFDSGGIVPGPIGVPKHIVAHGGETILPTHKYQTGGRHDVQSAFSDVGHGITKIENAKGIDKILNAITELLRTGGLLDDLGTVYDQYVAQQTRSITTWANKLRHGVVSQIKTNVQIAHKSLDALEHQGNFLNRQSNDLSKALDDVKKQLAFAQEEGKKADVQKLKAALTSLKQRQSDLGDKIAQNLTDRLAAQEAIYEADIARFDQRLGLNDLRSQILAARADIAGRSTGSNRRNERRTLNQRGDILREERDRIREAVRTAIKDGNIERARALKQSLLENRLALLQNTKALQDVKNQADKIFSFNSTAWLVWRQALLNGNGGILPNFPIPSVSSPNISTPRYGAPPIPRYGSPSHGSNDKIDIHITEPMEVADPVALAGSIAFKLGTMQIT
jgi:hypothetical protein